MLIDTHCHIHFDAYKDDGDEVIRRAFLNGVKMITVGTKKETSAAAVGAAARYENGVWAAVGLHPGHLFPSPADASEEATEISKAEVFDKDFYRDLAHSSEKVVGIGECGLDFYRMPAELSAAEVKSRQIKVFKEHIHLATELNLPLIAHVREAHKETIDILHAEIHEGNLPKRGVIHCFSGNWADAQRYFDLGFLISFTGTIIFPPKKGEPDILREAVEKSPLDMIMAETDSPYLAPPPYRGKRNEPSYVKFVAERIAEIKGVEFEKIAKQTTENAKRLFNLPL